MSSLPSCPSSLRVLPPFVSFLPLCPSSLCVLPPFVFFLSLCPSSLHGQQQIVNNEKCRQIAGNSDCYGNAVVQHRAHRPVEHIQDFTWSHWMPPLFKCLRRIAPAAAMVNKFEWNTQNTTQKLILASNYGTVWSLVVYENLGTQNGPSTHQLIDATSFF